MLDRRELLASLTATVGLGQLSLPPARRRAGGSAASAADALDTFIREKMERDHIPGAAACLFAREGIRWAHSYGWADLERRRPMTLDGIQNICSISKTFTTAALMTQWEAGKFRLDDDVNDYLPFPVRNPRHPDARITFRHLLTHRSSIRDGSAYARRYQCGDSTLSLADWIRGYLTPGGADYDPAENFHPWAPEGRWDYCNVAYGLIALLAEKIAGRPFATICRERIFVPLGMTETSWFLADVDLDRHTIPYTYVDSTGKARGPSWGGVAQGVVGDKPATGPGLHANCFYNHPNYPDGFLRTSVSQLARYARAYLGGGALGRVRMLEERTVRELFTPQFKTGARTQGLTWYANTTVRGQPLWGHGGSDPGINTDVRLLIDEGIGAIVFLNTNGVRPEEVTERILSVAADL